MIKLPSINRPKEKLQNVFHLRITDIIQDIKQELT